MTTTSPTTPPSPPLPPPATAAALVVLVSSVEAEGNSGTGRRQREEGEAGRHLVPENAAAVVIDVWPGGGGSREWNDEVVEKVCRICHLKPDPGGPEGSELMQIGCACKGELGCGHRRCAEAWFRVRGNRYCEICGLIAKNIIGEEDKSFMESWHEGRSLDMGSRNSSDANNLWRNQSLCNILLACLVIAFIIPLLFRVNML